MSCEFYGPTSEAMKQVNDLLAIDASGQEQDWEIEFADVEGIDAMLKTLESTQLEHDAKAALCLLLVSSFEAAFEEGTIDTCRMRKASELVGSDPKILRCMKFYWLDLGRSSHRELVEQILSS